MKLPPDEWEDKYDRYEKNYHPLLLFTFFAILLKIGGAALLMFGLRFCLILAFGLVRECQELWLKPECYNEVVNYIMGFFLIISGVVLTISGLLMRDCQREDGLKLSKSIRSWTSFYLFALQDDSFRNRWLKRH